MKTAYRIAAIAVIVTIVGLITWLSPGSGGGLLFADVLRKVREVGTATFTMTVELEGQPPQTVRNYLCPGRSRQELMDGAMVMIYDAGRGQGVTLAVPTKQARMVEYEPSQHVGFLEGLKKLRDGSEELLGTQEIDGRMATGFHVRPQPLEIDLSRPLKEQQEPITAGMDWTIWADLETGLPIRVEVEMDMQLPARPTVNARLTMSDFEFDVDLDESLFSLDAPEGYSMIEVDTSKPLEEQAEEALKQAEQTLRNDLSGPKGESSDKPSTGETQEPEQARSSGEIE